MSNENSADGLEQRRPEGGFAEAVVTRTDEGEERLYIGDISGVSLAVWRDGSLHKRYHVIKRVNLPERMGIDALIDWLESGPAVLKDTMESDVPECFGTTVQLTEWYPNA